MPTIWFERKPPAVVLSMIAGVATELGRLADSPGDPFSGAAEADAVLAGGMALDGATMDRAPRLRIIARNGIGYDNVDVQAATKRGILVCNAPDAPTVSTAEHAIMLLMATTKELRIVDHRMRAGQCRDFFSVNNALELAGLRLGLVGMGRIGARVARFGQAIDMDVSAYDPALDPARFAELGVRRVTTLEQLLAESDVVSLHLPATPETRNLMNATRIDGMKAGAVLINASRGALIDEDALLAALKSGHLRGAGLDVYQVEPPAPDHPLLQLDNVIATPHVASATTVGRLRLWTAAAEQILEFFAGRRPKHLINAEVWDARR